MNAQDERRKIARKLLNMHFKQQPLPSGTVTYYRGDSVTYPFYEVDIGHYVIVFREDKRGYTYYGERKIH